MATHSNGMSARQLEDQLGVTYKTAWLLTQKLRRSMVDPDREPLEGVVEVDQAEIPFREGDAFFEPGSATILGRASQPSGVRRVAVRRQPECDRIARLQCRPMAKFNPPNPLSHYI